MHLIKRNKHPTWAGTEEGVWNPRLPQLFSCLISNSKVSFFSFCFHSCSCCSNGSCKVSNVVRKERRMAPGSEDRKCQETALFYGWVVQTKMGIQSNVNDSLDQIHNDLVCIGQVLCRLELVIVHRFGKPCCSTASSKEAGHEATCLSRSSPQPDWQGMLPFF